MNNKLKCPSNNIISNFVDGDLPAESEEFTHILNCKKSQKTIDLYTEISKSVQKDMSNIDHNITDRIKKGVFDKLHVIEFEAKNDDYILQDEEFEWLAAGTKKEESENKRPKK